MAVSKQNIMADCFGGSSSRPPNQGQPPLTLRPLRSMQWTKDQEPRTFTYAERRHTPRCIYIPVCAPCFQVLGCDVDERQLIQFLWRDWLMDWVKRSPLCPWPRPSIPILHYLPWFSPSLLTWHFDNTCWGPAGRRREVRKDEKSEIRAGAHLYI